MTYGRPGVYVNETLLTAPLQATGGAAAAGACIGAFAKGPEAVTLVTSWYDFVKQFGGYNVNFPATFGVNQFFTNGGTELFVQRVLGANATAATANIPSTETGVNMGTVTAKNKGADGNNLRFQISKIAGNAWALTVYEEVITTSNTSTNATNDVVVETYTNIVFDNELSGDFVETVVNNSSKYIVINVSDTTKTPAVQAVTAVVPLTTGTNGDDPVAGDYADFLADDGTSPFDAIDRPLVLFAPELYTKFSVDGDATPAASIATVHDAMIDWADAGNGFAVLDTKPGATVNEALTYVDSRVSSSHAAAYYPHYYITDPLGRSRAALRKVGPASATAGLYLATDRQYGPFKTPAGMDTGIRGAISLERSFTPADLDNLNTGTYDDEGTVIYGTPVNAIRNVPGAGIVVMGGRTLLQDGTANRYVNTRRSLIYITKELKRLTEVAVFQNNDYKLWRQLRSIIGVFLDEYRNQGGLRGASATEAFFVKVDAENNTAQTIANGEVHIEVGVALEYPAEFVVINLTQLAGN